MTVKSRQARARKAGGIECLRAENLAGQRWLVHGFSTRQGGVSARFGGGALNLGLGARDALANVMRNRRLFLAAVAGRKRMPLVTLRQVHSDQIHRVEQAPSSPLPGDGLITAVPGLLLAVQTADCLPVILVDAERRAVGIFHAGWRGTLARIVEKGMGAMRAHFATRPEKLLAAIGPGIHGCCYAVGKEVREKFESQFDYAGALFQEVFESDPVHEKYPLLFLTARAPGHSDFGPKLHLDLVAANRRQLLDAGLPKGNVWASPRCTSCRTDLLFAHRAQRGVTGRMMGVVGVSNIPSECD